MSTQYSNLLIGAHTSSSGDLIKILENAYNVHGARVIQIFVGNPRGGSLTKKVEQHYYDNADSIKNCLEQLNMELFVHCPYVWNFAKDPSTDDGWWIESLFMQLKIANAMGSKGCILHMGKHVKLSEKDGKEFFVKNIKTVLKKCRVAKLNAKLFLETAAGQGTELYVTKGNLDPLVELISEFSKDDFNNLSFCVDTCHIFAAGYDIRTEEAVEIFFAEWESKIGMSKLGVVHMNNSLDKFGAKKDRHAPLKDGHIHREGLAMFAKLAATYDLPMIIETAYAMYDMPNLAEFILDKKFIKGTFEDWVRAKQMMDMFSKVDISIDG